MFDAIEKALGLVTQYNSFTTAPGGLAFGNNCVVRRENVYEDRRGYAVDATLGNNVTQLMGYMGKVLAHNGSTMSYGPSTYANYAGSYSAIAGLKLRFAEAASNLFVATSLGTKIFADVAGTTARQAGMPRMLDPSYVLNAATTGFLTNGSQCAYRSTISRTDQNTNLITGYPSQRLWVVNASGNPKNIDLTLPIPAEALVGDVVSIYRTQQYVGTSSDLSGDECALVYQYTLASGDVSAGTISFTDIIVDALRGASLYTNASQQGIAQGNDRPPIANDLALFKTFMLYANCSTKQRLILTMVGTTSLSGQTLTIAGTTYNFGASEITSGAGSPQALVGTTGIAAADIDSTARSLVRVINRYAGNSSVYAYYLSGPTDLPGQIMLEERGIGAAAYTVQGSNAAIGGMFYPPPPVSPATTSKSISSNQVQPNAVYYSKDKEYEHVPTLNYLLIGAANKKILRIVPLRNSTIVIKEEGIYRITGDSPSNFSSTPLDLTVFCRARDSVAALANQVFMMSNQGVVSVSENGVQVISRDISNLVIPLLTNAGLSSVTYGIGYESEGCYLMSTLTNSSEAVASQTLVYNIYTKTWVRWTFGFTAAMVEATTDKLYFALPNSTVVNVERKSFTDSDYADPEQVISIAAISGQTCTITTSGSAPQVGWAVAQGSTSIPITNVITNPTNFVVTLATAPPSTWNTGAALIYPSVGMAIEYLPWVGGNPGSMKQVRMVKILVDSVAGTSTETSVNATFHSNFDDQTEIVTLSQSGSGWGSAWGSIPWGGGGNSYGYPTFVPRNKQYCTRLMVGVQHVNAFEKVSILGIGLEYEAISGSIGR